MYQTIDPSRNMVLDVYPQLSDQQLQARLLIAQKAFEQWSKASMPERVDLVRRIAHQLRQNREACGRTITREMGKPLNQALSEIDKCILLCAYCAQEGPAQLAPRRGGVIGSESEVHYQPLGAVLGIMPWNFPFWQVFRYAIPSILAGNVVLLKPAPNVPESALLIETLFAEAAPEYPLFETLLISVEQVEDVIAHPIVQGVTLTGSDRAGASVAAKAGQHLKKCVLELGGSDPFLILEDADLEAAVSAAIQSRFNNSGQTCIAAKRILIHADVYQQAISMIADQVEQLKIGDPLAKDTDIGPLARPDLLDQLERQVKATLDKGATVRVNGGKVPQREGNFFRPMVLENIPEQTPARDEELFGPVFCAFKVASDEEALALANDTPYGLGAAVWTRDMERAKRIAMGIASGTVVINGVTKSDPALPFGGIKRSGFGRELGPEGIRAFTNIKTIVVSA